MVRRWRRALALERALVPCGAKSPPITWVALTVLLLPLVRGSAVHACLVMDEWMYEVYAFRHAIKHLQLSGVNVTEEVFIPDEARGSGVDPLSIAEVQRYLGVQAQCPIRGVCTVIVGPGYSSQAIALSPMAELMQVPIVSFSATSPSLSESATIGTIEDKISEGQYPFFARVIPADDVQALVMVDLLSFLGYNQANAIYTAESYGEGLYNAFEEAFLQVGGMLAVVTTFGNWEGGAGINRSVQSLSGSASRVSIAVISGASLRTSLLESLMTHKMLDAGWMWIMSESFLEKFRGDREANSHRWAGILIPFMRVDHDKLGGELTRAYPEGIPMSELHMESLRASGTPTLENATVSPAKVADALFSAFVADATTAATLAASRAMRAADHAGREINGTEVMMELLQVKLLDGYTGSLNFTAGGGRSQMDYSIYNTQDTGFAAQVGTWTASPSGRGNIDLGEAMIVWPGGAVGVAGKPTGVAKERTALPEFIGFGSSMALVLVLLPLSYMDGGMGTKMYRSVEQAIVLARQNERLKEAAGSVVFRFRDSGCNGTVSTKSFLEQQANRPPLLAVIGGMCSEANKPVGRLTGAISVPQIAIESWSTEFSDRTEYPHFFRVGPDNCRMTAVYVRLCEEFRWHGMTVVAVDNAYGRDAADTFARVASSKDMKVHHQVQYGLAGQNRTELLETLARLANFDNRVVIVFSQSSLEAEYVIQVAREAEITGLGWQWLLGPPGSPDSQLREIELIHGAIWVEVGLPPAPSVPIAGSSNHTDTQTVGASNRSGQARVYSEELVVERQALDATTALLEALSSLLPSLGKDGRKVAHISETIRANLSTALTEVDFDGSSGPVSFNIYGERKTIFFDIHNMPHADGVTGPTMVGRAVVDREHWTESACATMSHVEITWRGTDLPYYGLVFGGGANEPPMANLAHAADPGDAEDDDLHAWEIALYVSMPFAFMLLLLLIWKFWRRVRRSWRRRVDHSIEQLEEGVRTGDECLKAMAKQRLHNLWQCTTSHIDIFVAEVEKRQSLEAGVSVAYLLSAEFTDLVRTTVGKDDPAFRDMADFRQHGGPFFGRTGIGCDVVCPRTHKLGCALVDWLPRKHRGKCTHYLSWTWGYRLSIFQGALRQWLSQSDLDAETTFLYVCFFCNNQYRLLGETESNDAGKGDNLDDIFLTRLRAIGHLVAMFDTWDMPMYLTRIWTIYEQFTALKLIKDGWPVQIEIVLPPEAQASLIENLERGKSGIGLVERALLKIDSVKAEAAFEQDKRRLWRKIKATFPDGNGFLEIDTALSSNMSAWVGSQVRQYFETLVHRPPPSQDDSSTMHATASVAFNREITAAAGPRRTDSVLRKFTGWIYH